MNIEKLAYSIKTACVASSYSRSHIYQQIKNGRLEVYRRGGRIFITAENLQKLISEDAASGSVEAGE